jgi:hypothetical protein
MTATRPEGRVAVLSPSAALPAIFPAPFELGLRRLRAEFGLEPVEYPTTRALGGFPADRARDLHAAFADPAIAAVFTSIGGDDQLLRCVHSKNPAEVPLAGDQHSVGDLGADGQHEAFGVAARAWRPRRDLDHLNPRVREDRVERLRERDPPDRVRGTETEPRVLNPAGSGAVGPGQSVIGIDSPGRHAHRCESVTVVGPCPAATKP